ncbi:MAG: SpoIID/LytB domain-containing protein [Acidimicrobiales bacterium]
MLRSRYGAATGAADPEVSMPPNSRPPSPRRRTGLLAVLVTIVSGVAIGTAPVGPGVPAAQGYLGDTVNIEGHGFGHGRGLGQYGSLGYALDFGWDHKRILAHYYGGTTAGSRANDSIDVHLRRTDVGGGRGSLDGIPLIVDSGQSFTVGSNRFSAAEAARISRTPAGWLIERGPSCNGPWAQAQLGIDLGQQPTAVVDDPEVGNDISRMIQVCTPNGRRHYRGDVRAIDVDGESKVVNRVPMEGYLRGVVPRESPASWGDLGGGAGLNQLRAQSVAARSYAWAESRAPWAKTCDTTSCQVYGGAGLDNVRIEDSRTDRAIGETAGEVRLLGGAVARTEFSSSTGGYSAGGTFPAVRDEGDAVSNNPNHTWQAKVPVATVEARYPAIGSLFSIDVTKRNGLAAPHGDGGRVLEVVIRGNKGSVSLTGPQLRSAFGLKSDWFRILDPVLTAPAVGVSTAPSGDGYWIAARDGGVFRFGDAQFYGSMAGKPLALPVVGMSPTPSGKGYWLVATDGGIFSFGDATFKGSTGAIKLNKPIVGMASTPRGGGYWLVASDGGIFAFGDARFHGSTGAIKLNQPIVGMSPTPSGNGYWLVARDGGIFAFGDARFFGSTGAIRLNQPIVGMASTPSGGGYWFVAADGGVFRFGDARFFGSGGDRALGAPVVGMASTRSGGGYRILKSDGGILGFGDAGA